jgi:hypothetical protein
MLINTKARGVAQEIVSLIEADGSAANTEDLQRQLALSLGGVPWVIDAASVDHLVLYIVALHLRENA